MSPLSPGEGLGRGDQKDESLYFFTYKFTTTRKDKSGSIEAREPKLLARLSIDGKQFIGYSERLLKAFGTAVGAPALLTDLCARRQTKYLRGIRAARAVFVAKQAA
ncbi:hypothetical protein [Candidatus Thiosymbion oneisti]|uniref:hypothetical protein n=1 Tax=Candidatus Thiosymbion oneisti TaxID=589554 RepID=UPI0013FD8305|nr:hypothetical protein [Candidatus Thiosymbion oneisti]